jgi:hypothetical protein
MTVARKAKPIITQRRLDSGSESETTGLTELADLVNSGAAATVSICFGIVGGGLYQHHSDLQSCHSRVWTAETLRSAAISHLLSCDLLYRPSEAGNTIDAWTEILFELNKRH